MQAPSSELLLKSALEKIVYFEARTAQLQRDAAVAEAETERHRRELKLASARELELRTQLTELEMRVKAIESERDELATMNAALRSERQELMTSMLDTANIQSAGEEPLDLARFISQLREEVLSVRTGQVPAPKPPEAVRSSATLATAAHMQESGRLAVPGSESRQTRGDDTFFDCSVRELKAQRPETRISAAQRLAALGDRVAAPSIAATLQHEDEPAVQVAMLASYAALSGRDGVSVASPFLAAASAEVRIEALKAVIKLDPANAAPYLASALCDADRSVRRRAALFALSLEGEEALRLGKVGLADADAEVRAVAVLVLGASRTLGAKELLLEALQDRDEKVRVGASRALERIVGRDLGTVLSLSPAERRRRVRRVLREEPPVQEAKPRSSVSADAKAAIISELRASLRGRTVEDLTTVVGETAELACAELVREGVARRRGLRYFVR